MDFIRSAAKKVKRGVTIARIIGAVMIGQAKGNLAAYYDTDTKLQQDEMEKFWDSLNGIPLDYDELHKYLRENPSVLPKIQALFDLLAQRMNRQEEVGDEFIVDEPTAIAFMYRLLVEEHPEMTFSLISEADARALIDSRTEPIATDLPEQTPYGQPGGKKRKSKSSKKSKKNKARKSKKCNKSKRCK